VSFRQSYIPHGLTVSTLSPSLPRALGVLLGSGVDQCRCSFQTHRGSLRTGQNPGHQAGASTPARSFVIHWSSDMEVPDIEGGSCILREHPGKIIWEASSRSRWPRGRDQAGYEREDDCGRDQCFVVGSWQICQGIWFHLKLLGNAFLGVAAQLVHHETSYVISGRYECKVVWAAAGVDSLRLEDGRRLCTVTVEVGPVGRLRLSGPTNR
jgi:hypothetical protein